MPSLPCYIRVIWTKTKTPLAFRAVSVEKFDVKQNGMGDQHTQKQGILHKSVL
jgi:hypothetical protein